MCQLKLYYKNLAEESDDAKSMKSAPAKQTTSMTKINEEDLLHQFDWLNEYSSDCSDFNASDYKKLLAFERIFRLHI